MTFGDAIEFMKQGRKVAREGWDEKGMFIFMVEGVEKAHADFVPTPVVPIAIVAQGLDMLPYFCMLTAQKQLQIGWLASQADMTSEDWRIVE